jgi:adhesin transport system outer membrane protein
MKKNKFKKIILSFPIFILLPVLCQVYGTKASKTIYPKPLIDHKEVQAEKIIYPKDAILAALKHHPEIKAHEADYLSMEHRITQAKGGYMPTLDANVTGAYEYTKQNIFTNALNSESFGSVDQGGYSYGFSAKQVIFDDGGTDGLVTKAEREQDQAKVKTEEVRLLKAYDAASYFVTLRRLERLLNLAKENIQVNEDIFKKVKIMFQAGRLTVADVENVSARLADAQSALQDIQSEYNAALANYIETVGKKPSKLGKSIIPNEYFPRKLLDALALADRKNRSNHLASRAVSVSEADSDITQVSFMPVVTMEVSSNRSENRGSNTGSEVGASALISANWNLFNGCRDIGKQKEYAHRLARSKYLMKQQKNRTRKDTQIAWFEKQTSKKQAEALRKAVTAKNQIQNAYLEQFNGGRQSLISVLDANHEYFLAKGALITADAREDTAGFRLLVAMGELFEKYGVRD